MRLYWYASTLAASNHGIINTLVSRDIIWHILSRHTYAITGGDRDSFNFFVGGKTR